MKKYKPIVLLILDGWGISPSWGGNALAVNNPVNMNRFWRDYPHKVLQAFTMVAGKYGVVGDSRLGHSTIAAGRRIPQDLEIISEEISNNKFYRNQVLLEAIDHCQKNKSNLHLLGLASNGGIHSHINHLFALLELCYRKNFERVYIDAITDGIDSGQFDALGFVGKIQSKISETGIGKFSSLIGRFYAMDRIGDFDKTSKAYELLVNGQGQKADSVLKAISKSYQKGLNDFKLPATVIQNDGKVNSIFDNDAVIFFNFRADRSLQLTKLLLGQTKKLFWHPKRINNLNFITFTEYEKNLSGVKVAFSKKEITETLGEILAKYQEKQLRLAESEKAAHVTSFFNCGREAPFPGETRKIVPSRKIADSTKYPEMETSKIAQILVNVIKNKTYDFILTNFANVDMLSHSGDIIAAGKAIYSVDTAIKKVVDANLAAGGATIVTADHGNIEQMVKLNPEQDPETKHTLNPVPFIIITPENKKNLIKSAVALPYFSLSKIIEAKDTLADIAPTILEIMGLPKSEKMTGHSLLNRLE